MAKKLTATQKANANNRYSSFWFDDDDYAVSRYSGGFLDSFDEDEDGDVAVVDKVHGKNVDKAEKTLELIKLGAFMRSCGNFVRILTERDDIVVRYSEKDESYTDGKTVTLSSNVEGNFDSTVGLALHEASHIVKTDFSLFQRLFENSSERRKYITMKMIDRVVALNPKIEFWDWKAVFGKTTVGFGTGLTAAQVRADLFLVLQLKELENWIEDRRIDSYVYNTAPGYRGYYESLYNRYFFSEEVTKQLKEGETFNTETMDSYSYQIINSLNESSNPDILKGMREIRSLINVGKIDRLTNTTEVTEVAAKVLSVIMDNITALDYKTQKLLEFGLGDACKDENGNDDGMSINIDSLSDKECKAMFGMGKAALKKLLKKMQEQKDFVGGDIKKKSISAAEGKRLTSLQSSGVTVELAGGEEFMGNTVQVLVIKKLTDATMDNRTFNTAFVPSDRNWGGENLKDSVQQGFVLGKLLGGRLQIRNEEKSLKFTRQDAGKMDKRLVASLGYDVTNVFSKIETNRFNKAHIHISVDASGSMSGTRFKNAIKTCIALAVASHMTQNIECVISFRTTTVSNPLVYVAYDSRVNQLSHIRKYFHRLIADGTTPESLCFEAMMHGIFPSMQRDEQFFFVNLSDGEPCYQANNGVAGGRRGRYGHGTITKESFYYGDEPAYRHCKRMVDKMIRNGATVISYLISDYGKASLRSLSAMYGVKNAFNINTDSVEQIARTMNKKFLEAEVKTNDGGGSI